MAQIKDAGDLAAANNWSAALLSWEKVAKNESFEFSIRGLAHATLGVNFASNPHLDREAAQRGTTIETEVIYHWTTALGYDLTDGLQELVSSDACQYLQS